MSTNQTKNKRHLFFMELALRQARINLGNTKENPSVGCVVIKNNSLISAGHTTFNGRPHAEHNAINNSKEELLNSSLYVTLEPCSHYGKTPPCVKKIIKNKIKTVYFSIIDPDLRSLNKSAKVFRRSNIKVNIGLNSKKIQNFYKSYVQFKKNKLPFVTCKLAISKDFFTINKKKKWITNKYSRGRVHLMRSNHDAIITSSRTIDIDNPYLNCRINGLEETSPSRIILDNYLKIKLNSNVVKYANKYKTIIFYNKKHPKKIKSLKILGIKVYKIPTNKNGDLDLKKSLNKARTLGFYRIFLETGLKLSNSFLKENLVNDLKIFMSNEMLNKNGSGSIKKYFKTTLIRKKKIIEKVNLFDEKLITYILK